MLRLAARFEGVSRLVAGQPLPVWRSSRLNARYQPALQLAELVLRQSSFDLGRGRVPAVGFLVNMATVFERFVERALGAALVSGVGGRVAAQEKHWLDAGRQVLLRPDLLWYPFGSGVPGEVVDAKYKAEKPAGFPNADVYQLLAYCTALGLAQGHLVYAQGNESRQEYELPGVTVYAHTVDLDVEPEALLGQVSELARAIAGSGARVSA